ncbi:MAG TPA: hypothetical protein P5141_12635, partial [Candidatus Hydrogenedentes bacterium]|nr:hypothetical protein [Candidatus Hydrogenedentota bacterium]
MILDKIVAQKRLEVAENKARKPLDLLAEEIGSAPPPRDFREALRRDGISLIAEIKRRSPSRGDILPGVDPVELAALYEQSGARALSILTDGPFFGGSLEVTGARVNGKTVNFAPNDSRTAVQVVLPEPIKSGARAHVWLS